MIFINPSAKWCKKVVQSKNISYTGAESVNHLCLSDPGNS